MKALNDFMGVSIFHFGFALIGLVYILKALNRERPNVTGAAKKAAANKAVSVLSRLFK